MIMNNHMSIHIFVSMIIFNIHTEINAVFKCYVVLLSTFDDGHPVC